MKVAAETFDRAGLLVLCAAAFVSMASMRLCDPLLPAFSASFDISTGNAALTVSSFAVAYGFFQLLFGPLGDRFGKFRVIACAVVACVLGNALAAWSGNWESLVAARTLSGATAGGIIPLTLAWVGDSVSYERRQEVLGHVMVATLLGISFGQWMAGALADSAGWRWAFILVAAAFALIGAMMVVMGRSRHDPAALDNESQSYSAKVRQVLSQKWARWILLITAIEGAFAFAGMTFIPAFLHERFDLSLKHAAAVTALFSLGGLVYASQARRMVARLGERGLSLGGASLMGVSLLALVLLPSWHWAMPACLLGGLGFTMLHATLQTHATQMAPKVRGTATALFGACIFLGQSVGILAAASVVDTLGIAIVFWVSGPVIMVIGAAFARSLLRRVAVTA